MEWAGQPWPSGQQRNLFPAGQRRKRGGGEKDDVGAVKNQTYFREKTMAVRLHLHAQERIAERGASEEEVKIAVEHGEEFPAKLGRTGFRCNFSFDSGWR